jgi:hypothetical protein
MLPPFYGQLDQTMSIKKKGRPEKRP